MTYEIPLILSPEQSADRDFYIAQAASIARIDPVTVVDSRIIKKSIDARRGHIKVNLKVRLYTDPGDIPLPEPIEYPDVSGKREVIVVGAGPAGLFAALRLIQLGLKPVVIERGKPVPDRKKDIAQINRNGAVDPDSNYAFGEGGAGTFSDGKLYTRSRKRGDNGRILDTLVFHGAGEEITYESHPHIGTDKLPGIITNIRESIEKAGGRVLFNTKVTGFEIKEGCIQGVRAITVSKGSSGNGERIEASAVILATGHSASDIYENLARQGIALEAKPFAMGVRIEHPQELIDSIQYRMPTRGKYLPAASYSLVTQVEGRGVYSFCMCPGGFIVPAMTDPCQSVVNGMSPSQRNSPYANSGIVTEIKPEDLASLTPEHGVLAGLRFRDMFEKDARINGGDAQAAPAQRVADFLAGKRSATLPQTSYVPGLFSSEFTGWMPRFISGSLRAGITEFGRKMRGFVTNEAIITGVESRTSTPVRIPRDPETLCHTVIKGLFPCGEGAGYAGGIVSAAMDGERCAEAAVRYLKPNN